MTDRLMHDLASGKLEEALAEVAEAAARVILPYWRSGTVATAKADQSPVTQADQEAETLILSLLKGLYPDVAAVAEEHSEAHGFPPVPAGPYWMIDPLDGTRGFVAGKESFTVNIALIDGDRPVAGVISTPATALTWRSGHVDGRRAAFRRRFGEGWSEIRVRDRPAQGTALLSHSLKDEDALRLASRHGCDRWEGMDSSLKFCLIAEGRFDAYPRVGPTREWDTAAGQAILEAAGGRVLAEDGRPLAYGKPEFLNAGFVALGG